VSNDKSGGGGGGFLAGLIIGALVGGVAAVMLSQEETRDLLVGKAREAGNMAMDATGDLRGKVTEATAKVTEATAQWQTGASDLYERGKQVVDGARSNFEAAVDEGRSTANKIRDDLQHRADA
jgi:gas vesicle protein